MPNAIFDYNTNFTIFGKQHLVMLAATIILSILLPLLSLRFLSVEQQLMCSRFMSVVLSVAVVLWLITRCFLGEFDRTTDLPLDICNLAAVLMPFLMWSPSRQFNDILYFWILAGTFQAILTPYLYEGYPHFTFLKYWIVHGGLVVYIVYVTVVFELFPDGQSIVRAFAWLQVYAVCMYFINRMLRSNYFYIIEKPPTASVLDYFGPWPWYILVCEGLALILFGLAYLPVYVFNKS